MNPNTTDTEVKCEIWLRERGLLSSARGPKGDERRAREIAALVKLIESCK